MELDFTCSNSTGKVLPYPRPPRLVIFRDLIEEATLDQAD